MKENHNKQQKEHLLQSGNKNPVFRPLTYIHQIDNGLCGIYGINQQMDDRVDNGNAKRQKNIAD